MEIKHLKGKFGFLTVEYKKCTAVFFTLDSSDALIRKIPLNTSLKPTARGRTYRFIDQLTDMTERNIK